MKLKFIQIVTSGWRTNTAQLNITVYGLTKNGEVYKFVQSKNGWVPLSMTEIGGSVSKSRKKVEFDEGEPF